MISIFRHATLSSALALAALQCGGRSTPASSPEALSSESSGHATETGSAPATTAAEPSGGALSPPVESGASMVLNDEQIASITDNVNRAEIEQAQLAQQKSNDPRVQSFAAMMIEHHGQARRKQQGLNVGEAESPLGRELTHDARQTLESLKGKQGAEFDRAYMQAQVEGHQKVLDTIQRELRPNAHDSQLGSYLAELEPQVAQHLQRAQAAQQELQKK